MYKYTILLVTNSTIERKGPCVTTLTWTATFNNGQSYAISWLYKHLYSCFSFKSNYSEVISTCNFNFPLRKDTGITLLYKQKPGLFVPISIWPNGSREKVKKFTLRKVLQKDVGQKKICQKSSLKPVVKEASQDKRRNSHFNNTGQYYWAVHEIHE